MCDTTTNPRSPEAIAEELALQHNFWQFVRDENGNVVGREANPSAVAAILEAMRIQREQDAQVCESNFKPEDDCEFECHRADAAAIRGAKP